MRFISKFQNQEKDRIQEDHKYCQAFQPTSQFSAVMAGCNQPDQRKIQSQYNDCGPSLQPNKKCAEKKRMRQFNKKTADSISLPATQASTSRK